VTSIFGFKGAVRFLRFSRKRQDGSAPTFFQGLEKYTCSLQPALRSNAPGLLFVLTHSLLTIIDSSKKVKE